MSHRIAIQANRGYKSTLPYEQLEYILDKTRDIQRSCHMNTRSIYSKKYNHDTMLAQNSIANQTHASEFTVHPYLEA